MNNRFLNIRVFEDSSLHETNRLCRRVGVKETIKIGELTEEFYFISLWEELFTNALNSNGKAFSFEVPICTEYEFYEASWRVFGGIRIDSEKRETGNFKRFQRAFSRMPSGITYTRQETCFRKVSEEELEQIKIRFEQNKENDTGEEEVGIYGYTILVNVEKSTSSKLFNDNYRAALGFKEKLLREHKAILRECYGMIKGEGDGRASISYVSSEKVYGWSDSEDETAVYFGRFGMVDLSTPAEIFGFASAIMELAKQEGRIKENARVNYEQGVYLQQEKAGQEYYEKKMELGGIHVNIEWDPEKKSTPSLKAW